MILLGTEQMKLRVTQSRLEQSCNLGREDKSNWCLRSLELAAFSSALVLLFQASVIAFTPDMNWKTPVWQNCCSSCTSFFWALVFLEVREDHSSLHFFFLFSVAGKDTQCGERKAKLFLLQRELVEETLKVHSCRTGDIEGVRGVCDQRGEFQEWSGGLEVSLPQFSVRWCKQDPES